MIRFLVIFAIVLVPILTLLGLVYQYYGVELTLTGILLRTLGGVVAAIYVARRVTRLLGGSKKKAAPERPAPSLYERPNFDQISILTSPPAAEAAPGEPGPAPEASEPEGGTLADRLRQKRGKGPAI